MQKKIITGIDIGTYNVKVVIAERQDDPRDPPRILGTGYAESRGLRHGYIVNIPEATRATAAALAQASRAAHIKVKSAVVGISGEGLEEVFSRGETVVERGNSEITERDMQRAIAASEQNLPPAATRNKKILHTIPLRWSVDGMRVLGKSPAGMKGMKLGVEALFIVALEKHVHDFVEAVEEAGIEAEDVVASPLAASFVTLTKSQKRVGCVLANVGAETLSMIVFEDDIPLSLKIFPTGASDISGDLALGLKIPIEEAEQLKNGAVIGATYSQKKVSDIIHKRVGAMIKLVDAELKKIGKNDLLPAGVILTGGGSGLPKIAEYAQSAIKLPCRVAPLSVGETGKMQMRDGSWAVAYGLTVWGLTSHEGLEPSEPGSFKETFHGVFKLFKKFLP